MINYIIFTEEELEAMKNGKNISTPNNDGHLTVYLSEDSYNKMMMSMREKVFGDD